MAIGFIGGPRAAIHVGGPIDQDLQNRAYADVMLNVYDYSPRYIEEAPVETREQAWTTAATLARGGPASVEAFVGTFKNVMLNVYGYSPRYIEEAPVETREAAARAALQSLGLGGWC
jgi:hypothetical protein